MADRARPGCLANPAVVNRTRLDADLRNEARIAYYLLLRLYPGDRTCRIQGQNKLSALPEGPLSHCDELVE